MLLWNYRPESNLTQKDLNFFRTLVMEPDSSSSTQGAGLAAGIGLPPSGSRTRKEYRLMTLQEKQRFNAAMNKLFEVRTSHELSRSVASVYLSLETKCIY